MNVGQVIELAKEWVEIHGSQTPGFCGAHLVGWINSAPLDAPFPAYRDVDLDIILQDQQADEPRDLPYKGLILEHGTLSSERYRSPEIVLSDPHLAANLAVDSILSDPTGMLVALHRTIAQEYTRRRWVLARCESEKRLARHSLEGMCQAGSPVESISNLGNFIFGLTGLIAVANLKPPTHRRCLILMKTLLEEHARTHLQEELLALLGFAHLDRAWVEMYLQDAAEAFDRAVQVTRTPVPFAFKLQTHVRPYYIEGAQEMIEEGYPREAMLWILACLWTANGAIQADASEGEKAYFQEKVNRVFTDIEWSTTDGVASRLRQAEKLTDDVFQAANDIVRHHPEIVD